MDADVVGEGLLGERPFFAERCESLGEVHFEQAGRGALDDRSGVRACSTLHRVYAISNTAEFLLDKVLRKSG